MALSFTEFFGGGTRLTESLCQLYAEIIACQGMRCWDGTVFAVTNLGELGDARHQAEPTSRHNPMACPDGVWRICACDFGGLFAAYSKLFLFWQALYWAHDDRVWYYGFAQKGNGNGLAWGSGNEEWTGKDQGHAHLDVNMADASLANYSSFVPSMVSRRPWNLAYFLTTGRLGAGALGMDDATIKQTISAAVDPLTRGLAALTATTRALTATASQAQDLAFRAYRTTQVQARQRPPAPGDWLPPLGPGKAEPTWLTELAGGQEIRPGQYIWSPDTMKSFGLRSGDGLLVLNNGVRQTPLLAGGTAPVRAARLAYQSDGNLVAYDAANKPLWYTRTTGRGPGALVCQNDANVVIYVNRVAEWSLNGGLRKV